MKDMSRIEEITVFDKGLVDRIQNVVKDCEGGSIVKDMSRIEEITVFDLVDRIQNVVKDCEGMSNNIKSLILEKNPETEFETTYTNNAEIKQRCLITELNFILTDLAKLATNLQLIQRSLI